MTLQRTLFGVLLTLMMQPLWAQEDIDRTFMRRYNYGGMQGGLALTTTDDGGFIATGQHEGNGSAGGCDIYVYKVDACGNRIWFRLFGTGSSEGGKSIEPTPDGGFIIGGHGSPFLQSVGLDIRCDSHLGWRLRSNWQTIGRSGFVEGGRDGISGMGQSLPWIS